MSWNPLEQPKIEPPQGRVFIDGKPKLTKGQKEAEEENTLNAWLRRETAKKNALRKAVTKKLLINKRREKVRRAKVEYQSAKQKLQRAVRLLTEAEGM